MVYSVKQFTLQHCAVILIFVKDMKFPLLLDTYGVLLSERKREILDYYYNEDYSLSEISELTGISRQGVRDSIKKSEEEIYELEAKLKITEKNEAVYSALSQAIADLNEVSHRFPDCETKEKIDDVIRRLELIKPQGDRTDMYNQE